MAKDKLQDVAKDRWFNNGQVWAIVVGVALFVFYLSQILNGQDKRIDLNASNIKLLRVEYTKDTKHNKDQLDAIVKWINSQKSKKVGTNDKLFVADEFWYKTDG